MSHRLRPKPKAQKLMVHENLQTELQPIFNIDKKILCLKPRMPTVSGEFSTPRRLRATHHRLIMGHRS